MPHVPGWGFQGQRRRRRKRSGGRQTCREKPAMPSANFSPGSIEAGPFLTHHPPSRMLGTPRNMSPGQDESTERSDPSREPVFRPWGNLRPVPWGPCGAWDSTPPGFYLVNTLTINLLEPPKEPHSPKHSLNPQSAGEPLSLAAPLPHHGRAV